ncbi:hypothetical protein C3731_07240 [Brucella oryzae]|uniref:Uncharacterized protein n=1 Tax=Brucella oryzae TaxID=335286 RepID=A0A2S7J1I6_9HYPH|nr:hypothetical protein C3731_07240 [Brucella oryzae]
MLWFLFEPEHWNLSRTAQENCIGGGSDAPFRQFALRYAPRQNIGFLEQRYMPNSARAVPVKPESWNRSTSLFLSICLTQNRFALLLEMLS